MRKSKLTLTFLLSLCSFLSIDAAKINVNHVHPMFWWSGMHSTELQIMIHGMGLGVYDVQLKNAKDIELKSVNKFDNKNYIILYVDTKGAPAQTFSIDLVNGKKVVKSIPYELKERKSLRLGNFDASDVMYLLMPDRFAQGFTDKQKEPMYAKAEREKTWNRKVDMARHGGDLAGMSQHMDYLRELGITAIWPTPTLSNDMAEMSYHGYAITDYYQTDPRLGTNEDYKSFVQIAHDNGIKVIKDIVFNHCGSFNFLFADRPADDWFNYDSKYTQTGYKTSAAGDNHASCLDKQLTVDGWFVETMPDFNGKNKLVADYLIQASKWWVEYAGVDGFRQDTYPYNDFNFMKRWCHEMDEEYPGFNIVGETWVNNNVGVSYWQKDSKLAAPLNSELKTVMDFPLMYLLTSVVDEETDEWDNGLAKLYAYLSQDMVYANTNNLLTFLANHDTDRFQPTKEKAENITRYKQALALLLTLRGTPQLYYGDEIGMYANKSVNDGALRQDFPGGWAEDKNNAFTKEGRTKLQNEYFDFSKRLLNWRKGNKAVAYGTLTHYAIRNGVYVYSRLYKGQRVTVLINGTSKPQTVDASIYEEVLPSLSAFDVMTGKRRTFNDKITLGAREVVIMDYGPTPNPSL
ncbi:MAG: glycoside hydrolase family 13 protein [Bacteroidaceae bacterium]|nr:glycoside hydrolase family 13 protein [Bacteroidaceae bacterium]